jgi:hypothetical protein
MKYTTAAATATSVLLSAFLSTAALADGQATVTNSGGASFESRNSRNVTQDIGNGMTTRDSGCDKRISYSFNGQQQRDVVDVLRLDRPNQSDICVLDLSDVDGTYRQTNWRDCSCDDGGSDGGNGGGAPSGGGDNTGTGQDGNDSGGNDDGGRDGGRTHLDVLPAPAPRAFA